MPDRPRLLIVDDHAGFRRQARKLLDGDGLDVVGEAGDGDTCQIEMERLQPDLVLLDVRLPGVDGFTVAERIARRPAAPLVVLTSSRPVESFEPRLLASPAIGFVAKHELSGARLLELLRRARPEGGP